MQLFIICNLSIIVIVMNNLSTLLFINYISCPTWALVSLPPLPFSFATTTTTTSTTTAGAGSGCGAGSGSGGGASDCSGGGGAGISFGTGHGRFIWALREIRST